MIVTVKPIDLEYQAELRHQVEGWIKLRFLMAYILFISIFLYRPSLNLPYPVEPLLAVLISTIAFNSFSLFLLNFRVEWVQILSFIQVGFDFIIITIIFQLTGGVDSPFDWLYLYLILAAGLVGGLKFSLVLSLLSLISSSAILWLQYFFWLPHFHVGSLATHSLSGFHDVKLILSKIISNGVMFFGLGSVSGYIANRAEERRIRLATTYQLLKQNDDKVLHAITVTQENERKRVARELHDQGGQSLALLISNLQLLEGNESRAEVKEQLASLRRLAENLLDEVHNIIFDLRPSILDDLGIIASIRWYARTYIQPLGINVEILVTGNDRRLDEKREIVLYRVLQEALSNIIKHAAANVITIIFHFQDEQLKIQIRDNGVGFDVPKFTSDNIQRWGLIGMKERVEMLRGEFTIESIPGTGTCLTVVLPLMARTG